MSEQELVSSIVEETIQHYYDRFLYFFQHDQHDTAISIGDEVREWMDLKDDDEILYYNTKELKQRYQELVKSKRRRKS